MALKTITCISCGEIKTLDLFTKDSSKKDGIRKRCKVCQNSIARKNYKNPKQQESKKKYRESNKEKLRVNAKQYRSDNIEVRRSKEREYNDAHRDARRSYSKQYYMNNAKDISEKNKQNRSHLSEVARLRRIERRNTDPYYNLTRRLRARIRTALNGTQKSISSLELLGCSIEEFKHHLQNTAIKNGYLDFDINNYSGRDFHIDHIKPCASFDLNCPEEQKECFNWSNMQILTSSENLSKGDSYE